MNNPASSLIDAIRNLDDQREKFFSLYGDRIKKAFDILEKFFYAEKHYSYYDWEYHEKSGNDEDDVIILIGEDIYSGWGEDISYRINATDLMHKWDEWFEKMEKEMEKTESIRQLSKDGKWHYGGNMEWDDEAKSYVHKENEND